MLIERDRELLEAIADAKAARQQCESGDRSNLEMLQAEEQNAAEEWAVFRAGVVEDFLFALRVTMENHSLPLSNILDEAYPNLQIRTLQCDMAQMARAIAALEVKVK